MSARLLTLLLALSLAACTAALTPPLQQQELSGVISSDLTLGGEILLTGDLLILPGRTLTLLPGTTIHVRTAGSSKIDPEYLSSFTEILVRGTLRVDGAAAAPISFLPETPGEAGEIAWAGVTFDRSADGFIRYARIEGAEQGILAIASSPQLSNNTIRHCRYGIVAQSHGAPTIYGNHIEAGEGGLFVIAGARADIVGNDITGQSEEGLFVDSDSRPHLGRNEITANDIGLLLHNPGLPFDRSGIRGNREDLRIVGEER